MTTVTWATVPIPAHRLAVGDRVVIDSRTWDLIEVEEFRTGAVLTGEDDTHYLVHRADRHDELAVHVPDEPVGGYNLFKPRPGWSPLGCTCLSRRHPELAGNWDIVATDPDCRSHGIHDDWED